MPEVEKPSSDPDEDVHIINVGNPVTFDGFSAKIVGFSDEIMVVYVPGRSVYLDSVSGTQYEPAKYYVLKITDEDIGKTIWAKELMWFPRSV